MTSCRLRARGRTPAAFWMPCAKRFRRVRTDATSGQDPPDRFRRHAAANRTARARQAGDLQLPGLSLFICGKSRRASSSSRGKPGATACGRSCKPSSRSCGQRRHQPIPVQGKWLRQVVKGYFNYHAVPTNIRCWLHSASSSPNSGNDRSGDAVRKTARRGSRSRSWPKIGSGPFALADARRHTVRMPEFLTVMCERQLSDRVGDRFRSQSTTERYMAIRLILPSSDRESVRRSQSLANCVDLLPRRAVFLTASPERSLPEFGDEEVGMQASHLIVGRHGMVVESSP